MTGSSPHGIPAERGVTLTFVASFEQNVQISYRFSNEPEIVAARELVDLRLPPWTGQARQIITVHPAGIVTLEVGLDLPTEAHTR